MLQKSMKSCLKAQKAEWKEAEGGYSFLLKKGPCCGTGF